MCANLFWLRLIACLVLATGSVVCFETQRLYRVGRRVEGDQLLVKDVRHSSPAGAGELPQVFFKYEIQEPIICIDIMSDENISAEVNFSLVNRLVVGKVQLAASKEGNNETTLPPITEFDVTIMVFGLNESATNFNPSLVINPDQQFEGVLSSYEETYLEPDTQYVEVFDNNRRDALEVDEEDMEDISEEDIEMYTDAPEEDGFEKADKTITIGNRQAGDQLLYELYQTSPDDSEQPKNRSMIFYFIDTCSITYVQFDIFNHYTNRNTSEEEYTPPVAEYSHYSRGTLKAVITDFNSKNLFVQMYVYGYRGREAPASYVPFLPLPQWQRSIQDSRPGPPHLTPLQTMQLLLLTGQMTTPSAGSYNESSDREEQRSIKPEEMMLERIGDGSGHDNDDDNEDEKNSALRQMNQGMVGWLGLLLLILHN
ncbi:uncharacterized protein LOC108024663 [Drosophila biarmipes]|uniref:uncharacterized protein LOC108024663 n=1 Tax=Drosophila biarmipes TaxID=125945 RepID=UPI0007E7E25D|nr:uncharacterized protein LOC108024663 [Drosophila biarmipes]